MRMYIFILTMVIVVYIYASGNNTVKESNHVKIAEKVSAKAGKEIEKAFGISLIGSGGRLMFRVDKIKLVFGIYRAVEIEEARKMVIKSVDILLNKINKSEEIRPYLCEYPFKVAEIDLNFHILSQREICLVYFFLLKGQIYYYKEDPVSKKLILIHEEPYEDAIRVLQKQENDTLNGD